MRTERSVIRLGVFLLSLVLLLCSCETREEGAEPESSAPSSVSASAAEPSRAEPAVDGEPIDTVTTEAMAMEMAQIYEWYCQGTSLEPEWPGGVLDFALGWLWEHDRIAAFTEEDDWGNGTIVLPYEVAETAGKLFLDMDISPLKNEYEAGANYSADYAIPSALELRHVESIWDGDKLSLTFRRYVGEYMLGSECTYSFVVRKVTEPPAPPFGDIAAGEILPVLQGVETVWLEEEPAPRLETVEIGTAQELIAFSRAVNSGNWDAHKARYVLTADIDLTGVELAPIGTNRCLLDAWDWRDRTRGGFNGELDGQGHTISGLTIAVSPTNEEAPVYAGLFATIGDYGVIKNLTLRGANVSIRDEGWAVMGEAAGVLAGASTGNIENCHVTNSSVSGGYSVGGLIGTVSGPDDGRASYIIGCSAENITVSGHTEVGGLLGSQHWNRLENSFVTGTVHAVARIGAEGPPHAIGGLIGHMVAAEAYGSLSSVEIKTQVSSEWVGSLIGYQQGGVTGCFYNADLSHWEPVDVLYDSASPSQVEPLSDSGAKKFILELKSMQ
ncbi:hypothetical protein LJC63_10285 [Ruminococcaceae bacterium OttesenSCG-928-L11]|nr:hypothetical protein [Ruminococcaceae bacterium OttesenSCG-928-L11]